MKELLTDKVLLLNTGALSVTMFTEIQEILKIILLIISISYTIIKMIRNKKGDDIIEQQIKNYFKSNSDKDCKEKE